MMNKKRNKQEAIHQIRGCPVGSSSRHRCHRALATHQEPYINRHDTSRKVAAMKQAKHTSKSLMIIIVKLLILKRTKFKQVKRRCLLFQTRGGSLLAPILIFMFASLQSTLYSQAWPQDPTTTESNTIKLTMPSDASFREQLELIQSTTTSTFERASEDANDLVTPAALVSPENQMNGVDEDATTSTTTTAAILPLKASTTTSTSTSTPTGAPTAASDSAVTSTVSSFDIDDDDADVGRATTQGREDALLLPASGDDDLSAALTSTSTLLPASNELDESATTTTPSGSYEQQRQQHQLLPVLAAIDKESALDVESSTSEPHDENDFFPVSAPSSHGEKILVHAASAGNSDEEASTIANLAPPSFTSSELSPTLAASQQQQLVRSRKSPESTASSNVSSIPVISGGQTTTTTQSSSLNFSAAAAAGITPSSSLDYDDFDLDYQLKLGPVSDGADATQGSTATSALLSSDTKQANMSKRDYDDSTHTVAPPPAWSALLADQQTPHLFKSTSSINSTAALAAAAAASTTKSSPAANVNQPIMMLNNQHHAPPIMPSLLTLTSAQLTSQELNKARPHFLFYPEQYSEFSGPNSFHQSAAEALANGDLLATATSSDHTAAEQAGAAATATLSASSPLGHASLSGSSSSNHSANWRHFGRPPGPIAGADVASGTSGPTSTHSNSTAAGNSTSVQVISLLNGSPILNKQSGLYDNLVHHTMSSGGGGSKLVRPTLKLIHDHHGQSSMTTMRSTDEPLASSTQPALTTIVVDNSIVPTTQAPTPATSSTTTTTSAPTTAQPVPASTSSSHTVSRSTTPTSEPSSSWQVQSSASGGGSQSTSTAAVNSSHAHQWFNYPHPNLHHNPLLLHHILNKPPSFYAHTKPGTDSASASQPPTQQQAGNNNNIQRIPTSPISFLSTTTTTTTKMPLVATQSSLQPQPTPVHKPIISSVISASHSSQPPGSSANSPPTGPPAQSETANHHPHQASSAINIIERPTYGARQQVQQQPVNMTLLQMQLNEMRAIAAQEAAVNNQQQQQHAGGPFQQQQLLVSPTPRTQIPPSAPSPGPWMVLPPSPLPHQPLPHPSSHLIHPMTRSPVSVLHHLVGNNLMMSPYNAGLQAPLQSQQAGILAPNVLQMHHHHHHIQHANPLNGKPPPLVPAGVAGSADLHFGIMRPAQPPLAGRIIGAPSFLQDGAVHTSPHKSANQQSYPSNQFQFLQQPQQQQQNPSDDYFNKSLLAHQTASIGQHQHHDQLSLGSPNFDSLSMAASMDSGINASLAGGTNQTSMMNDEDMSTYVALLASLNSNGGASGGALPSQEPPSTGQGENQGHGDLSNDLLLDSISFAQTNNNNNKSHSAMLGGDSHLLQELEEQVQREQGSSQAGSGSANRLHAQGWIDLLKSAKLIGLSDEVQAQIYRDHLAPLMGATSVGGLSLHTQSTTSTNIQSPTIASTTTQRPTTPSNGGQQELQAPRWLTPQTQQTPASLSLTQQMPTTHALKSIQNERLKNFYTLDMAASSARHQSLNPGDEQQQLQLRQLENLRQRQRQMAFIEAIRSSLSQMVAANETGAAAAESNRPAAAAAAAVKDLSESDGLDESLANSGSRPQPDWLNDDKKVKLLHEGSHVHELTRLPPPPFHQHALYPAPSIARPTSLFPHMRAPLLRAPSTLSPAIGPIYPLRSLWNSRHHYTSAGGGPPFKSAGPQPRLLWPVYPAAGPGSQPELTASNSARNQLLAQSTIPVPLVRLNPPMISTQLPPTQNAFQPINNPQTGYSMPLTPNRVMLDRFPMASAPAYLVKLPTLTGGTITASGSLVPPMPKFLRRPGAGLLHHQPPAAFISATPLGALRFLHALAPPRMQLVSPSSQHLAHYHQAATPTGLQSAPSTLHVGHISPLAHIHGLPSAAYPPPSLAPAYSALHPLSQLHHHHHHRVHPPLSHLMHHHHAPPPRLQIYLDGTGPPPQVPLVEQPTSSHSSSSLDSPTATTTTTTTISSAESHEKLQNAGAQNGAAAPNVSNDDNHSSHQAQRPPSPTSALTRLQQATLSLVELSSLASLLDEVVGSGSDTDSSPAIALANAINSLSAAQSAAAAAAAAAQPTASQTSERIVSPSTSGATGGLSSLQSSNSNALALHNLQQQQQQQQQQVSNNQAGALFWRNFLMPSLFRGQSSQTSSGVKPRFRDQFGALERLLAHTQAIGSPHHQQGQTARLKVKYIRVPVAVYETTSPAAGSLGQTTTSLNLVNSNGSPGALLSSTSGGSSSSSPSDGATDSGATSSSSGADSISSSSGGSTAATSSGSTASLVNSPAASPTSNEFFFDEMSSESGPQTHYLQNHFEEHHQTLPSAHSPSSSSLGYLPIVRSIPNHSLLVRPRPASPPPALMAFGASNAELTSSLAPFEGPGNFYSALTAAASSSPAATALALQSLLEEQQAKATAAAATSSDSKKEKKKRNKKKKKRKNKASKLLGISADDDEDEGDQQENETTAADDDDDDDAISANDLPIIESLISSIIHGPQPIRGVSESGTAFGAADSSALDPLMTSASSGGGWRSTLRARRPFGGIGRHRPMSAVVHRTPRGHSSVVLAPDASSNVYTYARPGDAQLIGAGRLTSAAFHRQRFSLGEVVGALGAKKLISSLLGRSRSKTARASKPMTMGEQAAGSVQHGASKVHDLRAASSKLRRPPQQHNSILVGSTTRMPPRDLLLFPTRRGGGSGSGSLFRWRSQESQGNSPQNKTSKSSNSSSSGDVTPQQAITFSPLNKSQQETTTTAKPRPLVYASLAAYDFDPTSAKTLRLKRRSTPGPRAPEKKTPLLPAGNGRNTTTSTTSSSSTTTKTTTSSPVRATNLATVASPAPARPSMISDSSSTNQDKMEYNFYLQTTANKRAVNNNHLAAAASTLKPMLLTFSSATPKQQRRHKDGGSTETSTSAEISLINATVSQRASSNVRTLTSSLPHTPRPPPPAPAMPLYHIVADQQHYNKANPLANRTTSHLG